MFKKFMLTAILMVAVSGVAVAQGRSACQGLPSHAELQAALTGSVFASGGPSNGGLDLHMWGTIVASDGTVCAVAKTGNGLNTQWLGSRVISAQKANTANAFSLQQGLALSTANLFSAVQPGGSLFGLQHSNPVDTDTAYAGVASLFGSSNDPMTGHRIGGVNVFGGGLALYDEAGNMVGALGVSGDTSCADHNIGWRTRDALGLDNVPAGLTVGDNIIYDIVGGVSASGFGHPTCIGVEHIVNATIIVDHPLGPNP